MKEDETILTEEFLKNNNFKKPGMIAGNIPYTYENDNFRITVCLTLKQYIYLENKITGISMEFKYINQNKISIQDLKKCLEFMEIKNIFNYEN